MVGQQVGCAGLRIILSLMQISSQGCRVATPRSQTFFLGIYGAKSEQDRSIVGVAIALQYSSRLPKTSQGTSGIQLPINNARQDQKIFGSGYRIVQCCKFPFWPQPYEARATVERVGHFFCGVRPSLLPFGASLLLADWQLQCARQCSGWVVMTSCLVRGT